MASLVDTNVLVYRHDPRHPAKQRLARDLLRPGLRDDRLVLAHQSLIEFVAAVTRPRAALGNEPLLAPSEAHVEAESLLIQFPVLYPDREVFRTALYGAAAYQLSWFDAHLWAYAEVNGLEEILSEDFEHGRHYGGVRAVDPFLAGAGSVHELPPLYADDPAAGPG